jgi:predicted acyltransferase
MILVDDAGGAYERIDHSPWNGCTLADFVMPFFLFIVGVAIAFALKVRKHILCTSCCFASECFMLAESWSSHERHCREFQTWVLP